MHSISGTIVKMTNKCIKKKKPISNKKNVTAKWQKNIKIFFISNACKYND